MDTPQMVKRFIERHGLLSADGGPALVGVSGGADSVCLLLLLLRLGYVVEAVHCNFRLRGEESDSDERFVGELCKGLGVKLHTAHFDTRFYAEQHRLGIETAARRLRYAYFEQLRRDVGAQAVCVAHHQDDSAETVLMNLLRGTGLHGLTGIKPRNGHVVRPLLCLSRQQVQRWLHGQGQAYVTDSSNLVPDVVRNQLRLQVMPLLRQATPSAVSGILATARHLAEAGRVYDDALRPLLEHLQREHSVSVAHLLACPSAESVLYEWLSPAGFTPAVIEQISQRLPQVQGGRYWQSDTHQLVVHGDRLELSALRPVRPTMLFPEPGSYTYDATEHFRISLSPGGTIRRHPAVCCLDASRVQFPLTLRPVSTGDRFRPFGMKGSKLVSDFLTDLKLSIAEKRRQLALTDAQGRILWLVDHRPDGRFAVTPETQQVLFIEHITSQQP